jgi:hypothetical protein
VAIHSELGPDERRLTGAWDEVYQRALGDEVEARIIWLIRHRLRPRASANGGWDQLFVDPRDGRYWDLTFPRGSLHGGGPRQLTLLTPDEAAAKYGDALRR